MTNKSKSFSRYYAYIKPVTNIPIIKNYGSTIFTLIIMIIFIFFAIKPTVETITVLQKKLADSQQVLNEINTKVQNLSLGKENYDQLDPTIKNKIKSSIPDNITFNSLVSGLEQTALKNQASISALQIQPLVAITKTSDVGTLSEIDFTFNVEGGYQNLISLLQELKGSDRLISVERVVLSKLEAGQGILMSISGKAYFLK